jgi:hypothetical protein
MTLKSNQIGSKSLEWAGTDTAIVLFFLALEYGRSVRVFALDGVLMAVTMVMVLVLPYFLPSNLSSVSLARWVLNRAAVMSAGLLLGIGFGAGLHGALPKSFSLVPMTFLILASMVSCYIQFYQSIRLRPVK